MGSEVPDQPRKTPTQARARSTVDAIVVAAAHLLKTEGIERMTTNRIAEVAGVSIGSLYQYFPNKHAVIALLRDRHSEWIDESLRDVATGADAPSLREQVRPAIDALIAVHRVDPALHRGLAKGDRALDAESEGAYRELLRAFLVENRSKLRPLDADLVTHVAVRALEAVVHGTALDAPERLDDPAFAHEVTELLVRYIEPRPDR